MRLSDIYAELKQLVDDSAVLIRGKGSGFFVAPGRVITCAHVASTEGRAADQVMVIWRGRDMRGTVRAIPADNEGGQLWGYPDLALIEIEDPPVQHPWVWLDETPLSHAAKLYAVGYSTVYTSQPGLSRAALDYVGPQQFGTGDLLKVKDDELASGMSGGPVLDLSLGGVCGVIKTSRQDGFPHGGLVIPAGAIVKYFPELTKIGPSDDWARWSELRAKLRHASATRGLLEADEESQLISAIAMMQQSLDALFRLVVGELRAGPEEPLLDEVELVREVADSVLPAPGESHPLVRLCDELAARTSGQESRRLRALAGKVAGKVGQRHLPLGADQGERARRSSAVEVHLTPYAPNPRRHLLTIFSYGDIRTRPAQIFCDDRPLTLREIRSRVKAVLPKAVAELHDADDLTIEFTLPHRLLGEGVDEWDLGTKEAPLGSQFPVIIRVGDRPPETSPRWWKRWESFHAHDGDHNAVLTWVDCRTERIFQKLYGCFQLDQKLAVLAVSYQPSPDILQAMLYAGIPIALWPRQICKEHVGGVDCFGDRFHDALTKDISRRPLRDLPVLVKTLRTMAIIHDNSHYYRGLTLLWDDPTRQRPDEYIALGAPSQGVNV